jgi:hypothetical protein
LGGVQEHNPRATRRLTKLLTKINNVTGLHGKRIRVANAEVLGKSARVLLNLLRVLRGSNKLPEADA